MNTSEKYFLAISFFSVLALGSGQEIVLKFLDSIEGKQIYYNDSEFPVSNKSYF